MIEAELGRSPRNVWSVSALVHEVAELVGRGVGACTVRGEISGYARAASGHCYFNLKDADSGDALLRCAMFRRSASLLAFTPADGQLVEVRGRIGVYEPRGELQFVAEAMQRGGDGALYEQFLRLKARLESEGLFDATDKRVLPAYPSTLGIVSSLGAAALRDVLTALARRAPHVRAIVYPSLVQGADAPGSLVAAIERASQRAEVDVLIVCRGGGSLEDLWAFNDERVVRAIRSSRVPVVVGVGHETDVTLADFAADLRAPTPTAAAELAAPTREACLQRLQVQAALMRRCMRDAVDRQAQRLDRAALRLARPGQSTRLLGERLRSLGHRLAVLAPRVIEARHARLARTQAVLQHCVALHLGAQPQRLAALEARLRTLDPAQVLARGYAWITDEAGRPMMSIDQFAPEQAVKATLHDGVADMRVGQVRRERKLPTMP